MTDAAPFVLPNHIQGEWSAAVLLTYTANLGFFESQLLPQLNEVPIRIVLADSDSLTDTFERAKAAGEGLRRANRSYVVSPIRHNRAAHAKAILLLAPTKGWLAVGSGNLGLEGYASPGELWHTFAYDDARPEHRHEFEIVRELIDGWLPAVDPPARDAVQRAWSAATWLGTRPQTDSTVRHNLRRSFIDQLAEVATAPVRTMRVHAPFYDRGLSGLATLLQRVPTERLEVLTTRDTSIEGSMLEATVNALGVPTVYGSIDLKNSAESGTYLHAKWIHLVLDDREVLLAGSPNLSSPALARAGEGANIELATLRIGAPGAFDRLYEPLSITPTVNLSSLRFAAQESEADEPQTHLPRLVWAKLEGTRLTLEFDRPPDRSADLRIVGVGGTLTPTSVRWDDVQTVLELTEDDATKVSFGYLDVLLDELAVGTVWPYRLDALHNQFASSSAGENLKRLHEMPTSDADMMERLAALEQTLIIDFQSAWRLSHPGKNLPESDTETDEPVIRLEDLDWHRIRRSPQHQAYGPASATSAPTPTGLQVALAAISGRLGDLGQVAPQPKPGIDEPEENLAAEPSNEDESADQDDDEQPRRLSVSARTRMAWARFIDRYVRAIGDERFMAELGPHAAIQNAAIFASILTQLLREHEGGHRLADPLRVIQAQLALWRHLWGDGTCAGLLDVEDPAVRDFVDKVVRETRIRASVLDAIEDESYDNLTGELRQKVRQQLERVVSRASFDLVDAVHETTGGGPAQVDACIDALLRILAPRDDLEKAAHAMGRTDLRFSEIDWDTKALKRYDPRRRLSIGATERVLTIHTPIRDLDHPMMAAYLARLAVAELMTDTDDDYWRIHFQGNGKSYAFWDARFSFGTTNLDGEAVDQEFDTLAPQWPDWWTEMQEIRRAFGLRRTA